MDFCYIRGFRLAMLGKKVWNFLTNPKIMVSQIFKAWLESGGWLEEVVVSTDSFKG